MEVSKDMDTYARKVPLGVCASIAPFNFPAMIPLWTIPMAAVTGNTLILKPSERDPGAAMIIAELCREAGLPAGVLNIVHGGVPTVNALCDHPKVKAVSFVGGDAAGKHIYDRQIHIPSIFPVIVVNDVMLLERPRAVNVPRYISKLMAGVRLTLSFP